jgi:hypothetical protein
VRSILLVLLLVVTSAGNCPVDVEEPKRGIPPRPVAGNWAGELYGVRVRLTMTESGQPDGWVNATNLGGSGWLVYGSAPAESVEVALLGFNGGGPDPGVVFEVQRPLGTGGVYGDYSGKFESDGSLVGPFQRKPSLEPTPSPWTATWPAGVTSAQLRLTRQ